MQYIVDIFKIIHRYRYDIIHVHGNSCTMAIELFAGKVAKCQIRIAHGHNTACVHKRMHELLRPLFERTCTDRIACSEEAGKWLFRGKKFDILENAIDLSKYQFDRLKAESIRNQLKIKEDEIVLGHIGIFNKQKNQSFVLKVFHALYQEDQKYKLLFIGQGEMESMVKKEAEELQLQENIIFYGVTDDVPEILSAMDIFIFPSLHEGLGIAAVEAQLMGLPCVMSDQVPDEAVISPNCRKLSLNKPLEEWCDVVASYTAYIGERNNHGLTMSKIKRFDIDRQVIKLEEMYRQQSRNTHKE